MVFCKENFVNTFVNCHQIRGPRGEAVRRQTGCPPGPGVQRWDKLSCVPETQQAAGVEELVGEWRILCRCGTQNRVTLCWRHSTNRIQVMRIHRLHKLPEVHKRARTLARERSKQLPFLFSTEQDQKIVQFLCDNEILYNKSLMDYKDRSKREAVWEGFVRTIWIMMPAKSGSRASVHSSGKSLT